MILSILAVALWVQAQQPAAGTDTANLPLPNGAGVSSFEFDWPTSSVPHWSIEIGEDGTARYDKLAEGAKASAETRQPITVGTATLARVRAGYAVVVRGNCETKAKHIAQTGVKRMAYTTAGSDVWSSCSFNHSEDKGLMEALTAFQAIAETMQYGEILVHTLRFDRLGLDADMTSFQTAVAEGRAIEVQNIAPVLQAILDDDRVLDRVHRKAARLLQDLAPVPAATSPQ